MDRFICDEHGAVTVDWIVLTAASVGLGTAVTTSVGKGVRTLTELIAADLSGATVSAPLVPISSVKPFAYTPLDSKSWETLLSEVQQKFGKASAAEFVDIMSGYSNNDGTIKAGVLDEYAAIQTVFEENGYELPKGLPDMRNF